MIRVPQVRVVDEDGAQLGVMPTPEALRVAQERGFDLVEVAPMAAPPVVRFLDYGQYKYELTKREKEAKRKQRSVTFKEVRLKPKIGQGDFDTKVRRAIEFLEDGDRIKVAVQFRGRELTHPEIGRNLLTKFSEQIKDHGVVERAPLLEGKSMHITVASTHRPKAAEAAPRPGRPEAAATGPEAPATGPEAPATAPQAAAAMPTTPAPAEALAATPEGAVGRAPAPNAETASGVPAGGAEAPTTPAPAGTPTGVGHAGGGPARPAPRRTTNAAPTPPTTGE